MGNSPSRNDLKGNNNDNNSNSNNNNSSTSSSLLTSQDDPDPLPIHLLNLSHNTNDTINTNNINNDDNDAKNSINYSISIPLQRSSSLNSNSSDDSANVFTPTSNLTINSSPSASKNYLKINSNLYSIKEIDNNSLPLTPNPNSPSPSTSPSSVNSNDLQFTLDLDQNSNDLNPLPPTKSLSGLKIKHPPPKSVPEKIKSSSFPTSSSPASSSLNVDIDSIIEKLVASGLSKKNPKYLSLSNSDIKFICAKARRIFMSQPMLLELAAPVKIVGDIHGQFYDLLRIFKLCGFPPSANYLFMGDYVDRGKQSLETMILLLCLKIKYPENFFLLRGNHETAEITKMYGFYDECKRRTSNGVKTWKLFVDVFNTLPVAATIADKIFCVHGGLSPDLKNLNQIKDIQRPTAIPDEGLLADLLWSDPQDLSSNSDASKSSSNSSSNSSNSKSRFSNDWKQNDRGVSYCFNNRVVKNFCKKFDFDLIARGHMVVEDGYEFYGNRHLVTIFSAPNYCGEFKNWGAVMNVNKKLMCSFELLKPREKKK